MLPGMALNPGGLLKLDADIGNKRPASAANKKTNFGPSPQSEDDKAKYTVHSISCPDNLMEKAFVHHKHHSNGSDMWIDGLVCAYEFIPAVKNKVQVGGKFGQKSGPVKGNFTAEITMRDPTGSKQSPAIGQSTKESPAIGQGTKESPAIEQGTKESPAIGQGTKESPEIGQSNNVGPDPSANLEVEQPATGTVGIPGKDCSDLYDPRWADSKFDYWSDEGGAGRKGRAAHPHHVKDPKNHWVPIGWARIIELVEYVQSNSMLSDDMLDDVASDDGSVAIADQAAPFWQSPAGPIWWCHVLAGHSNIVKWLTHAQWLHPAISSGLRDESRLISERMKHLFYEVPVRVGGGLLFELLGQSVGDPHHNEDDVPIVIRSFTSLNFLITAMHVKGEVPNGLNVIGISEVQDIVGAGGASAPRTAHEVVALLADRLARWDDRLFRKHYFGEADEVELKFVSRRGDEDLAILGIILNQEIKRLSTQVIRVKWALHAREEILYELVAHLRGKNAQAVLDKIAKSTRGMLVEQEAVRDRLFTVQDVMQSTVRASLQDTSVRIQHNLAVIGGGGLFLSIIAGLFGINVDGIPGAETPYAFGLFTAIFFTVGALIVGLGMMYLGFRKPPTEAQLASRKKELQNLVKKFQNSAESHEKVREVGSSWNDRAFSAAEDLGDDYILISQ